MKCVWLLWVSESHHVGAEEHFKGAFISHAAAYEAAEAHRENFPDESLRIERVIVQVRKVNKYVG